jgi:hypothetical protein
MNSHDDTMTIMAQRADLADDYPVIRLRSA